MTTGMLPWRLDFHHVMHEHGEQERVQKDECMCAMLMDEQEAQVHIRYSICCWV